MRLQGCSKEGIIPPGLQEVNPGGQVGGELQGKVVQKLLPEPE